MLNAGALTGKDVLALLSQMEVPEIEHQSGTGAWVPLCYEHLGVSYFQKATHNFRIKPTPARRLSVTLANGEVVSWPEPVRDSKQMEHGQEFFFIAGYAVDSDYWRYVPMCMEFLAFGNIHLTREAAQEHADALRKINTQEVEK